MLKGQSTVKDEVVDRPSVDIDFEDLQFEQDGIYVSGRIQKMSISFLVDTGATVSILSPEAYHRIPKDIGLL